jgi:hypothetical protein
MVTHQHSIAAAPAAQCPQLRCHHRWRQYCKAAIQTYTQKSSVSFVHTAPSASILLVTQGHTPCRRACMLGTVNAVECLLQLAAIFHAHLCTCRPPAPASRFALFGLRCSWSPAAAAGLCSTQPDNQNVADPCNHTSALCCGAIITSAACLRKMPCHELCCAVQTSSCSPAMLASRKVLL